MTETGRTVDADNRSAPHTGRISRDSPPAGDAVPGIRADRTAPPRAGPAVAPQPLSAAEIAALARVSRWIDPALVVYVVVAAALLLLALRRGRSFDAILLATTLFLTVGPILGYRSQVRIRLGGLGGDGAGVAGQAAAESPTSGGTKAGDSVDIT